MLSKKDIAFALIPNLKDWSWDINGKYALTKEEGEALIEILELFKAQEMMKDLRGIK